MSKEYKITLQEPMDEEGEKKIKDVVNKFANILHPIENNLFICVDKRTNAIYCECHINADSLLNFATTDVPLDPDEQPDYRANREIMEDAVAFEQMKSDALAERTFSNIVTEFNTQFTPDYPLKIIGGQHRFIAIREAFEKNISVDHGVKVYFSLDLEQRLDAQLISNVNIAVSTDLWDRLQETAMGPQLRDWCQKVSFLDPGQDFSAKRTLGDSITVRAVRSFIINFFKGKDIGSTSQFDNIDTTPILCKTGKPDPDWNEFRQNNPDFWSDEGLIKVGKEFILLDEAQRNAIEKMREENPRIPSSYANKALTFSVMCGWAYVAGILQSNDLRLKRHYDLVLTKGHDPLNAIAMAEARHKSDPENYRGLGTRTDAKERGRCVELFFLQSEKGQGITSKVADLAIKKYHIKQDTLEAKKIEASM